MADKPMKRGGKKGRKIGRNVRRYGKWPGPPKKSARTKRGNHPAVRLIAIRYDGKDTTVVPAYSVRTYSGWDVR